MLLKLPPTDSASTRRTAIADHERLAPADPPLEQLNRNGLCLFQRFLDGPTVGRLIEAVRSMEQDAQATRVRRGVAFARRNLLKHDFISRLIGLDCVQSLLAGIAPGLVAVRAILFDKTGAANWTVPWHQDRSIAVRERIDTPSYGPWSVKAGVVHVQPPLKLLRQMLTLRFHLDACGADNGPLRVIPGTHDHLLDSTEIEKSVARDGQVACHTDAGGLLAMRPLLLHASSRATRATHRRVIHIEFAPPLLPGGLEWAANLG